MKSLDEIGCGFRCSLIKARDTWGPGPWQEEPDRVDFEHAGLPCFVHRNGSGNWCGYAGVAAGHPLYGVHYSACAKGCAPNPFQELPKELAGIALPEEPTGLREYRQMHPDYPCRWEEKHTPDSLLEAHGGITYSGYCGGHLCHIPKAGAPDTIFWFGFDCGHAWDLSPGLVATMAKVGITHVAHDEVYRNLAYVRHETKQLAEQLAALA